MKLYLAHPILSREDIRKKELAFEERTGIQLVNPFYDGEEGEVIKLLDSGKITVQEYSAKLNEMGIGKDFVQDDLKSIDKSDGVVGIVYKGVPTVGTSCELWYAYSTGKKVYIITSFPEHIWLQYIAKKSGGFIVETWSAFEEKIREVRSSKEEKK